MEEDPFGSVIAQCTPTPSQELKFRNCLFARESDLLSENKTSYPSSETGGTSQELTGIVMVSVSDSSNEDSRSLLSALADQPPEPMCKAADSHRLRRIDSGGGLETTAVGDCCEESERAVDLGKDSDDLGFPEPKSNNKIGGSECESSDPVLKKSRVLDETVVETELIESELEEKGEELCDSLAQTTELLTENTAIVDINNAVTAGESELEKLASSTMRESVGGELAATENSPAKKKKQAMKDLIDRLKRVKEEIDDGCDESTDFIETAKKRGMIFPRPRWWPPEGFGD